MKFIPSLITASFCLVAMPALADTITCISKNNAFVRCDLSYADQRNVSINRVISGHCDSKNAWGVDSVGIWVDNNCGAVFQYNPSSTASNSSTTGSNSYLYPALGFLFGALAGSAYNKNNEDDHYYDDELSDYLDGDAIRHYHDEHYHDDEGKH